MQVRVQKCLVKTTFESLKLGRKVPVLKMHLLSQLSESFVWFYLVKSSRQSSQSRSSYSSCSLTAVLTPPPTLTCTYHLICTIKVSCPDSVPCKGEIHQVYIIIYKSVCASLQEVQQHNVVLRLLWLH